EPVVGHRPRCGEVLELQGDRVCLEDPYPDRKKELLLLILQHDDRRVRHWIEHQTFNRHWDELGQVVASPRSVWCSASSMRTPSILPRGVEGTATKFTTQLSSVLPDSIDGSCLLGPSTSTGRILPR